MDYGLCWVDSVCDTSLITINNLRKGKIARQKSYRRCSILFDRT